MNADPIYEAWFDGSSKYHLNLSGIGGFIQVDNEVIYEYSEPITFTEDIYELEYRALIGIVNVLHDIGAKNVIIRGDARYVINKVTGRGNKKFRLENESLLKELHFTVQKLLQEFKYHSVIWIPRELNERAHELCNLSTGGIGDEASNAKTIICFKESNTTSWH